MRCEVKDVSRDEAIILMVDSNSQRSQISPCDKGRAYKMKMEAIKRLPGRKLSGNGDPVGPDLRSSEKLAEESDDSPTQIKRYIRLTNLIQELQDFVDDGKIKMRPAVELSYLDEEAQRDVVDLIDETEAFPSHDQAIRIRKAFDEGKLDYDSVDAIMRELKPNQKPTFKLKYEDIQSFFKPSATAEEVLGDILKGLELLKKQRARSREAR
jgi:ParB family chromosome partitioning protein